MNAPLGRALPACISTVLSLMISSCALMAPPSAPPERAILSQLPRDFPRHARSSSRLLVLPPETVSTYDTVQMIYTTRPLEIAYFSHHEWGALPGQMLFPLLTQSMEKTGYFSVVITPPYAGPYDYALRTKILELREDFTSGAAVARLSLRLELTDVRAHQVIATTDIAVQEPMTDRTPYAGVIAENQATATALQQVADFVLDKASVRETARAP